MAKQTIEIEVPDGYEIDQKENNCRSLKYSVNDVIYLGAQLMIQFKKKKPKRRAFEETGEFRSPRRDEYVETSDGLIVSGEFIHNMANYKILKEITEE